MRQDKLSQNGGFINKQFIKRFENILSKFYAIDPPYGTKLLLENDKNFLAILYWHIPIKYLMLAVMGCEIMYYDNYTPEPTTDQITIKEWNLKKVLHLEEDKKNK